MLGRESMHVPRGWRHEAGVQNSDALLPCARLLAADQLQLGAFPGPSEEGQGSRRASEVQPL